MRWIRRVSHSPSIAQPTNESAKLPPSTFGPFSDLAGPFSTHAAGVPAAADTPSNPAAAFGTTALAAGWLHRSLP